jgi:hypothetical protein
MDEPSVSARVKPLPTLIRTAPPFVGRREDLTFPSLPFVEVLHSLLNPLPHDLQRPHNLLQLRQLSRACLHLHGAPPAVLQQDTAWEWE